MTDLKITDGILDELQSGLKSIVDQLRDSTKFSSEIGDLVGHHGLSGHVHDFASDWSVHRGKMIDGTTGIHDHVAVINTGFTQADTDLAKAFDQPADQHTEGAGHGRAE
ncbi:hypothetical protein GCM10028798_13870 [Humibacter antri]